MQENITPTIIAEAKKRGMTARDIERNAGIARASIRKWSTSSPTLASLEAVANALNIRTSTLVRRIEDYSGDE